MNIYEIIKQKFMLLVAMATVVGFSAFNLVKKLDPPQDGWYEVTIAGSNPDHPSQQILGDYIGTSLPSAECDPENVFTEPCAVYLDMSSFSGTSQDGLRVSFATDTLGAVIDEDAAENLDGYARKEE
ncbi:MAG TPA: hypothetical protein PKA53_06925 [Sphingobacterium sp.]|nr:hypothetical protein [Sphingobacterium sp.]